MPLQNRVLPTGDITAISARGTLTGNRGIIHRDDQTLGTSRWSHHAWIYCALEWQGRRRKVMTGRNWTELFFLDEATALAAGHRPCGYCRRAAYCAFRNGWQQTQGAPTSAKDIDRALHAARVTRDRVQITYQAPLNTLPSGAFIRFAHQPHLWANRQLHPYTPAGYLPPIAAPPLDATVTVLTPAPTVNVLHTGFEPLLHPSVLSPYGRIP